MWIVRSLQRNNNYYYNCEAFEYFTKAAELGDAAAHACLGLLYYGELSVEKDEKKAVYHFELAAANATKSAEREEAEAYFKKHARPLS